MRRSGTTASSISFVGRPPVLGSLAYDQPRPKNPCIIRMRSSESLDHSLNVREILRVFETSTLCKLKEPSMSGRDNPRIREARGDVAHRRCAWRDRRALRFSSRRSDGENCSSRTAHRFCLWLLLVHGKDPASTTIRSADFSSSAVAIQDIMQNRIGQGNGKLFKHAAHTPVCSPILQKKNKAPLERGGVLIHITTGPTLAGCMCDS